jgi:hypothetical protein
MSTPDTADAILQRICDLETEQAHLYRLGYRLPDDIQRIRAIKEQVRALWAQRRVLQVVERGGVGYSERQESRPWGRKF